MKLLSIDTTAEICSIAVLNNQDWHVFHQERPREHAKILLPEIERLLLEATLVVRDLDYIVFGRGPGSFTGIRIAAGVAHGLALSAKCPLIPISTLQSLAFSAGANGAKQVWSALDARMSEIYFAPFTIDEHGLPTAEEQEAVLAPNKLKLVPTQQTTFIGNGWQADYPMPEVLASCLKKQIMTQALPNAKDSAQLALKLLAAEQISAVPPEQALPVYLRDNVTWNNQPKIGS